MRLFLVGLFTSTILLACQTEERPVEDKLYACLQVQYEDNGIDLDASLDLVEAYLIEQKVLENSSGESKIKFYEKVAHTGEIPSLAHTNEMQRLSKFYPSQSFVHECFRNAQSYDSTQLIHTNYYRRIQKMKAYVAEKGETSPRTAAKAILANSSASDFDHPYYRAHMLLMFIATTDRDEAYIRKIPKKIERSPMKGGLIIEMLEGDEFLIEGIQIPWDEVENKIFNYLQAFDDETHIRFRTSGETNYQNFTKMYTIVEQTFQRFWNQKALEEYNYRFANLDDIGRGKIKKKYPSRIIEETK